MSEKQQRLVLAIIDFLNQSIEDGTVKQDDREGLEIAGAHQSLELTSHPLTALSSVQCIGEAFGVNTSDEQQRERLSIRPATLASLFDLFLETRAKMSASAGTQSAESSSSSSATPPAASAEDKVAAEKEKAEGNKLMSSKDYASAVAAYTRAIALDDKNAVYYSNRAAAFSSMGDHGKAIEDANKAIDTDPAFSKAYHRLG